MLVYTLLLLILTSFIVCASLEQQSKKLPEEITKGLASLKISTTRNWESSRAKVYREYSKRLKAVRDNGPTEFDVKEGGELFSLDAKLTTLFSLSTKTNLVTDPLCSCRMLGSRLYHPDELFEEAYERGYKSILKCLLTIQFSNWRDQERMRQLLAVTYKRDGCYDKTLWMMRWFESHFEKAIGIALIVGNEKFLRDLPFLPHCHDGRQSSNLISHFDDCQLAIAERDAVGTIRHLHGNLRMSIGSFHPYVEQFAEAGAFKILNYLYAAGLKDAVMKAAATHHVPEVFLRLVKDGEEVSDFTLNASWFTDKDATLYKNKVWEITCELHERLKRVKGAYTKEDSKVIPLKHLNQAILNSEEKDPLLLRQILERHVLDDFKLSVLCHLGFEGELEGILHCLQAYDLSEWDEKLDSLLFLCRTYKRAWYDETLWMALWLEVDHRDIMGVVYASGNTMLMKDIHKLPHSPKHYIPPHHHSILMSSMRLIAGEDAINAIEFALKHSLAKMVHFAAYISVFYWAGSVRILQLLRDHGLSMNIEAVHVANAVDEGNIKFIMFAKEYGMHPTEITDACFHRGIFANNAAFLEYAFQCGFEMQMRILQAYWKSGETSLLRILLRGAKKEVIFKFIDWLTLCEDQDGMVKILGEGAWDRMDVKDLDRLARERRFAILATIYDTLRLIPSYEAMMDALKIGDIMVFNFIHIHIVREANASLSVDRELVKRFPMAIIRRDLDTIYRALRSGYRPTLNDLVLALRTRNFPHGRVLLSFADDLDSLAQKVLFSCNGEVINNLLKLVNFKLESGTLDELATTGRLEAVKAIYKKMGTLPSEAASQQAKENGFNDVSAFVESTRK